MPVALLVLLAIFLLWIVSGAYVFTVACVRRKENPWLDEAAIKKTSYGKYCNIIFSSDRWLKEQNAQDIFIRSRDGLKLHAYWVPADDPKGTVLFAHGYRSTPLVDFGLAYRFYHDNGMNLLIPAQRCHGKSEGKYITFGVKESQDMWDWLIFHNTHLGSDPVILSGLSMGATTMLYLADQVLPENVRGIIADCGFTSPKAIIGDVIRKTIHLPAELVLVPVELFARIFAGFSLSEKDTRQSLMKSRVPVLMIHGQADDFVPCIMSQDAFSACCGKKKLLLVEGAGHGESFLVDREKYSSFIREFLKENVNGTFESADEGQEEI